MPEHVHLLLSEPAKKDPSKILQVLKQKVAGALLKKRRPASSAQLSLPFGGSQTEEAHFWQRRFYDFNVWSEKKLREKLEYMHANPVQRKLVQHPKDWPWSSWAHYAGKRESRIRIDSDRGGNVETTSPRESQNPHP
jgi:putative transposase